MHKVDSTKGSIGDKIVKYRDLGVPMYLLMALFETSDFLIRRYESEGDASSKRKAKHSTFSSTALAYLSLLAQEKKDATDSKLVALMHGWLDEEINFPYHVVAMVLSAPLSGYASLLQGLFGGVLSGALLSVEETKISMLQEMRSGQLAHCSAADFSRILQDRVFRRIRRGDWSDYVLDIDEGIIEDALKALNPRERLIIRHRYGLGCPAMTLDEVKVLPELGVTRERVRQIEQKALRRLIHPRRGLHNLVRGPIVRCEMLKARMSSIQENILELERRQAELTESVANLQWQTGREQRIFTREEVLAKTVEELELSERSYNVLKNNNVHTVRDLVAKREVQVSAFQHLGKKSLNEIKGVLKELDVWFAL